MSTSFRYPACFTPIDERQCNRAWQQAIATLKHTPGDPDAAAVSAVRQVLEVVAFTLERHRAAGCRSDHAAAAIDLRHQVNAEIDRVRTTIQTTLDAFEQIVLADLEQQSWRSPFQPTPSEPAGTGRPHSFGSHSVQPCGLPFPSVRDGLA